MRWVYNVAMQLFPFSSGAYGADLGPDHRDAALATKAFGSNRPRLASLKHNLDPGNVLAYACPLPTAPIGQKLIILVTGESCAGEDYCADIWVPAFSTCSPKSLRVRAVSISDATQQEYAAATSADLERLLRDRAYKEHHRPALSRIFQYQVRQRPRLPEEHSLNVLHDAVDVDVLFITGILLEVRVLASRATRQARRGCQCGDDDDDDDNKDIKDSKDSNNHPSLIFHKDTTGNEAAERFFKHHLLSYFGEDLQRLASMVRLVRNFPGPGIEFRNVLGISQKPGGLVLSSSLQSRFADDWAKVYVVVSCESGGFVYASMRERCVYSHLVTCGRVASSPMVSRHPHPQILHGPMPEPVVHNPVGIR
ncbi:hypothetical protein LTR74_017628 [Friedmanniomyces endolithicus]|nr:hypothetical protein LTR74_017628 [Friedmanniomyces endolithicus]